MPKGSFKLEGLKELDELLGQLPKATGLNVLRRAGRQALEPMAERARQLAPVEDSDLRDSISVSTKSAGYAKRIGGKKQSSAEVFMGPGGDGAKKAPPQGSLQEFGTKNHPPQPFMRPAWDEGKAELAERVGEVLGPEIMKAAERLARKRARLASKG